MDWRNGEDDGEGEREGVRKYLIFELFVIVEEAMKRKKEI